MTPLIQLHCPSRRVAKRYPVVSDKNVSWLNPTDHMLQTPWACSTLSDSTVPGGCGAAKNDYAINGGSYKPPKIGHPPGACQKLDDDPTKWGIGPDPSLYNGLCTLGSQVTEGAVSDGLSNTYLVGEKYLPPAHYTTGRDPGDCANAYTGAGYDLIRWANDDFDPDDPNVDPDADNNPSPKLDRGAGAWPTIFGSAHPAGWHVSFCDGSVRLLSYMIDIKTHQHLAARNDHVPIDPSKLQ